MHYYLIRMHFLSKMIPEIYDEGDGISLELPIMCGAAIKLYMDDKTAQKMIDIIQNKLNARFT